MKLIQLLFILSAAMLSYARPAEQGLYFDQSIGGSLNPLGLLVDSRFVYRIPFAKPGNILFESTKIDIGVENWFTPSDDYLSLYVNVEPIAVFDLTLRAGYQCLYNVLGFGVHRVAGPNAPYDSASLDAIPQENSGAWWIMAAPRLKVQLGNFIAAHTFTVNYISTRMTNYYVERHSDSIHKSTDIDLGNDTYFFYKIADFLMVGVNNFCLAVPSTGYVSDRISGMIVFNPTVPGLYDLYAVVMAGSFAIDHAYAGKLYLAAQAGFTIKLF